MNKKSKSLLLKFVISIIWDILDATIFRIPVIGTVTDIISVPLAVKLWGNYGYIATWEIADITDQLDSFVPTLTIIGLISLSKEK